MMVDADPACPKCHCAHAYPDGAHGGSLWVCPECGHEWNPALETTDAQEHGEGGVRDAVGNLLADGDSVTVIKDLKIKGSSQTLKAGTKVKNIRLSDGGGGHDIVCKIPGVGAMDLKSEFVRKA
ncbi:zinc ribbon domain-containing protein YjdM [Oecophyllibacter saccharovorans]|uniref:Alkylphosphonate utilization protein n=1 Tax=Oecophyllibacter saccharovorans TaxID=2558360 RepID=A0A506UL51_9PROT|nr:zinc ribbon domain-containing protein YjdM [Oecophyllibacter saccharovorans]TPW34048.1 alkylphosphonate utilization protein [Oecophyllibacter saccharovorans]